MIQLKGTENGRTAARLIGRGMGKTRKAFIEANQDKTIAELLVIAADLGIEVEIDLPGLQRSLTESVQVYLDKTALQQGYDSMLSLCSYANSSDPTFQAQGQAGMAMRDAVWVYTRALVEEVKAGSRAIPTEQELLAELQAL